MVCKEYGWMFCERVFFRLPLNNARLAAPDAPLAQLSAAFREATAPPPPQPKRDGASDQPSPAVDRPSALDSQQGAQLSQTLASIGERLEHLEQTRQQCQGEMQQAVVELSISIASRLVHQRLEAGDFGVEELVQQMLARFDPQESVKIHLHPDDLQLLQQLMEQNDPPWKGRASPEMIADESIERGDCRIDSAEAGLLSKIDLQLSEIRQHLLECLDDPQLERRGTQAANRLLRRFSDRRRSA
jgi:hypothetical protein